MAIKIGFCSTKGGVGKSTLALLTASLLHFDYKKPVTIIDCDNPQHSISRMRDRENDYIANHKDQGERLKTLIESGFNHHMTILSYTPESSVENFDKVLNGASDDGYVIVDFPGRWSEKALAVLSLKLDYLILPIEPVLHSLLTTLSFAQGLDAMLKFPGFEGRFPLRKIFYVWNKVQSRVPSHAKVMETFKSEFLPQLDGSLFDAVLPNSVYFGKEYSKEKSKEFALSTYFPPTYEGRRKTNIESFVEEVFTKCAKQ